MKKLILVLSVMLLIFTSCGSDDNPLLPFSSQNQIIGTWNYYKYFENDVEEPLDVCEDEETLIFVANGAFSARYFEQNTGGTCVLVETAQGTWISDSNSNYTIIADGSSSTEQLTFEGNTFYYEETYTDINGDIIISREVYIKQ